MHWKKQFSRLEYYSGFFCFYLFLAFSEIRLFSSFFQQMNSVRTTHVACSAWGFPFTPSRNDNEMVTPISFKQKGKPIKQERKKYCGCFGEFNCLFCYPLVSKFMSCLSTKKKIKKKKTLKYWHQSTRHRMANDRTKHLASSLKWKPWSLQVYMSCIEKNKTYKLKWSIGCTILISIKQ